MLTIVVCSYAVVEEFEEQLAELKAQKEAARRAALSGKSYNGQEIDYDVSNDEIDAGTVDVGLRVCVAMPLHVYVRA